MQDPQNKQQLENKKNFPTRKVIHMIMLVGLLISIFQAVRLISNQKNLLTSSEYVSKSSIPTPGCQRPVILPDYNIAKYLNSTPEPIICKYQNSTKPLVLSDATSLWVDEDALLSYGINNSRNVKCCYSEIYQEIIESLNSNTGPSYQYGNTCNPFWKKINVSMEYIRTNCTNNGKQFYTDFHFFVLIKRHVEKRCKKFSKISPKKINVLVLGVDSVSRLNFHRSMKKTAKYLNDIGAIEMYGFNKIGFGTAHNILAITTGLFLNEINEMTIPSNSRYLDSSKFIWKDYQYQGYRTAFFEDIKHTPMFYSLGRKFFSSPTDYYSPAFYDAAEEIIEYKYLGNFCMGTRLIFETLLTYVGKFVEAMEDRSYFGLFWQSSLTRKGLDKAKLADDSYLSVIKNLTSYRSFNNTILIFLSGHGYVSYYNKYKDTKFARLEASTPFLFFIFPKWFHSKHSEAISNLKENSGRLVTYFDLHETLVDLSDYNYYLDDESVQKRASQIDNTKIPRAISLFLPIPQERTCDDAEIPYKYCTCDQNTTKYINAAFNRYLADQVVQWINLKIKEHPQCSLVYFSKVVYATLENPLFFNNVDNLVNDWRLVIKTNHGSMTFVASGTIINKKKTIVKTVTSISTYRHRSECVDIDDIKPFCNCKPEW